MTRYQVQREETSINLTTLVNQSIRLKGLGITENDCQLEIPVGNSIQYQFGYIFIHKHTLMTTRTFMLLFIFDMYCSILNPCGVFTCKMSKLMYFFFSSINSWTRAAKHPSHFKTYSKMSFLHLRENFFQQNVTTYLKLYCGL